MASVEIQNESTCETTVVKVKGTRKGASAGKYWTRVSFLAMCAILLSTTYNLVVSRQSCPTRVAEADTLAIEKDLGYQDEPLITKWKNENNLVHVVLTRFMQHQPKLVNLGRARLELFKSFCVPTMRQQTSRQFLWIIRVSTHDAIRTSCRSNSRGSLPPFDLLSLGRSRTSS